MTDVMKTTAECHKATTQTMMMIMKSGLIKRIEFTARQERIRWKGRGCNGLRNLSRWTLTGSTSSSSSNQIIHQIIPSKSCQVNPDYLDHAPCHHFSSFQVITFFPGWPLRSRSPPCLTWNQTPTLQGGLVPISLA